MRNQCYHRARPLYPCGGQLGDRWSDLLLQGSTQRLTNRYFFRHEPYVVCTLFKRFAATYANGLDALSYTPSQTELLRFRARD